MAAASPTSSSSGSRDTPPLKDLTEIQTFRPTMVQFMDFPGFIDYMESQGAHHAGVAKVIPPPEWRPRIGGYTNLDDLIIQRPKKQDVQRVEKLKGVFHQYETTYHEMTVKKYEKLAKSARYRAPIFFDLDHTAKLYWQSHASDPPTPAPIYGATPGSLYDDDVKVWNINRLGTILDLLGTVYKKKIQGVNTPYLYFGMWKTTFCWHVEDMNLYSINYLHYGAPKFWYAVPPKHGYLLENLAASYYPDDFKKCPAFLRHKTTLMSPSVIRKKKIPVHKIEQYEGEFMVTFPAGYHAGFNTGYNCAESTNFATKRWIDFGKEAVLCTCEKEGAIRFRMDAFVKEYQTEEEYEDWMAKSGGGVRGQARQGSSAKMGGCTSEVSKRKAISKDVGNGSKKPRDLGTSTITSQDEVKMVSHAEPSRETLRTQAPTVAQPSNMDFDPISATSSINLLEGTVAKKRRTSAEAAGSPRFWVGHQYKLVYFNGRGRAEPARLIFAYAGVNYDDHRIEGAEWPGLKPKTPFGQLPILAKLFNDNGKVVLGQSKAIARYLGNELGLTPKDNIQAARGDMLVDGYEDVQKHFVPWFTEKDPAKKRKSGSSWKRTKSPRF